MSIVGIMVSFIKYYLTVYNRQDLVNVQFLCSVVIMRLQRGGAMTNNYITRILNVGLVDLNTVIYICILYVFGLKKYK